MYENNVINVSKISFLILDNVVVFFFVNMSCLLKIRMIELL